MSYAKFAIEHQDIFREAYEDIEPFRIGSLLDAGNFEAIGKLIWNNVEAAREGVEDNTPATSTGHDPDQEQDAKAYQRERNRGET